jgi:hypothetical protein
MASRETEVVTDVSRSLFSPAAAFFGALLLGIPAACWRGPRAAPATLYEYGGPRARLARIVAELSECLSSVCDTQVLSDSVHQACAEST